MTSGARITLPLILQIILKLAGASVARRDRSSSKPDDDTTPVGQIVEDSDTHGEEFELLQPDAHSNPLLRGL